MIGHWLVLRKQGEDDADIGHHYWRRIGLIRMDFKHGMPGQDWFSYGTDDATKSEFNEVSIAFKKALMEDLEAPEHTRMIRLG